MSVSELPSLVISESLMREMLTESFLFALAEEKPRSSWLQIASLWSSSSKLKAFSSYSSEEKISG